MAKRKRAARSRPEPGPAPLPAAERTVGQLVADTMRLYGDRFWASLALGVGFAALAVGSAAVEGAARALLALGLGPLVLSASLVAATVIALGAERDRAPLIRGALVGLVAVTPFAASRLVVFPGDDLLGVAWYALTALAVPAAVVERLGLADSLRRGVELARADLVHALGSVATLVIVIIVSSLVLFFLLASVGDQAGPYAAFLTFLVLTPLFFLGTALLYLDQRARVRVGSGRTRTRRRNADVHPAVDAHRSGPPDAEVEPGAAARGQP